MSVVLNNPKTIHLNNGEVLTLTLSTDALGSVYEIGSPGAAPKAPVAIAGANLVFGPYNKSTRLQVTLTSGTCTDTISNVLLGSLAQVNSVTQKKAVVAGGAAGN